MTPKLPIFTFDFKKEILTIQYSDGKIEKKETSFRGRWNSPGFNLEKIENEDQWLTFMKFEAKPKSGHLYPRIRLFFKHVEKTDQGLKITHYAQDKRYRDKITFELGEDDIIYKKDGKWVFKKDEKQGENAINNSKPSKTTSTAKMNQKPKSKIDLEKMVKESETSAEQTSKTLAKAQYNATDIAKYLLSLDPERKFFTKTSKGNARLQHMLHISQMLYCSKTGKPLFKDPMYAYPPKWYKLKKTSREELDKIIHNKEIKDKKSLIWELYQKDKVKLDEREKYLFWGKG